MSVHVSRLSRPARLRQASGIFFLTIFGAVWGLVGTSFLSGIVRISTYVLIGLVTLTFFGTGALFLRYARRLSSTVTPEEAAEGKRIRRWFGMVFGAEIVLIVLAGILLTRFGAGRFNAPVIALIVGVHFLPLARLFNVQAYYLTGVLLSLLALTALVALLFGMQIAGPSPDNWSLFVSMGATLVLWLTLLYNSRSVIGLLRQGA